MSNQTDKTRTRDLAQIHVAKRDLDLDDEAYRSILWTVARKHSAADLSPTQRQALLRYFKNRGWKPKRRSAKGYPGRPRNMDDGPRADLLSRVEAHLTAMGREWAYADAMALRMYKVDRVSWCNVDQLHQIVAALEADRRRRERREGVPEWI